MIETSETLPKDLKPEDRVICLKPYQDGFIFSEARYPALVSAWGTGKTLSLIEKVKLAAEKYKKNLILVLRREFTDLKDSTIKDWNENTGITVNSSRDAVFDNGSIVMFRHAEELRGNNLNNMNLGGFAIEQAEELETDEVFYKLQGRLRRKGVQHFGCIIANTNGHGWIYKTWKCSNDPEYPLFEATSFDNADVIPAKTIEDWKKLKEKSPKIYNRFVMNSWDEADTLDIIIQPSHVEEAKRRRIVLSGIIRRVISIDVARGGSDLSEFYAIENGIDRGHEEHNTRDSMNLVGRAQLFAQKVYGTQSVAYAVDEIGVGAGVADRLQELGYEVIFINAAQKDGVPPPYYNRRSEILGYASIEFAEGRVQINEKDDNLAQQLSWTKWKPLKSTGILQAESKDDIRERYQRSPDNSDAFVNGLWALQFVKPTSGHERITRQLGWSHPRFRQDNLKTPHYQR